MTSTLLPCGTWAAYRRHRRRGEDACEPCQEAQRARSRKRYYEHRERYLTNARRRYDEVVAPRRYERAVQGKTCPTCSLTFDTTNARQTFCCTDCRQFSTREGAMK